MEKDNVFSLVDEGENHSRINAFYQFTQNGSIEAVGASRIYAGGYIIGSGNNARTDVSKAEYEEYNSDFGELTESVSYDNMYLTLDKAYEKYLSE